MFYVPIGHPYVKSCVLSGLDEQIRARGVDHIPLFESASIPLEALDQPDSLISFIQYTKLIEEAAHATGNVNFGLDWSLSAPAHFPAMGPLMLLAKFSTNVRQWIELSIKFWHIHSNAMTADLSENLQNQTATLRYICQPSALGSRHCVEVLFHNVVMMVRSLTGKAELKPLHISFAHQKPKDTTLHVRLFQCPIEFDSGRDEILFDRDILSLPVSGNLTLFKPFLGVFVRQRMRQIDSLNSSVSHTVKLAISSMLGTGRCTLTTIAESLGMSTKKLQRQLEHEQLSFSYLIEDVRRETALRLLATSAISVERIAHMLDYTSNPAFTLAFKRFHSLTPMQYRRSMRALSPK